MAIGSIHPTDLIEYVAEDLHANLKVQKPAFAEFVKTGPHRERAPTQTHWYYLRLGSLLYRLHKDGIVGVGSLRSYYGGRKSRGSRPHAHKKAAGKIIRVCLQQLQSLGFVEKTKKGRVLSKKGKSYLNAKSKELISKLPELLRQKEEKQLAHDRLLEQLATQAKKEEPKQAMGKKKKAKEEGAEESAGKTDKPAKGAQ